MMLKSFICRVAVSGILLWTGSSLLADNRALIGHIDERLSHMKDVAAYKWINGLPIEDLKREATVLDRAIVAGLTQGIRIETSKTFFSQQIGAAKEIQRYWFTQWRSIEAPSRAPDLIDIVRPELIRLGNAITRDLATLRVSRITRQPFLENISIEGLSVEGEQQLFKSLDGIGFYDHRLQQILDAHVLRVGTTGDYAPFSFQGENDIDLVGIDIDLANNLAATMGVEIRFVHTSWPGLLADLQAGLYDMAMSGVSRNPDRRRVGYFSIPYHKGGKTPIALCKNKDRFNRLDKIDVDTTRIIVNPGGTNERFVDSSVRRAKKILHADNRTIFDEIIKGHADLMITDRIEVQLKSASHKELCATMPDRNLTRLDKGYLMPQDEKLKEYVDLWLATRTADGTIQSIFSKHLNQPGSGK